MRFFPPSFSFFDKQMLHFSYCSLVTKCYKNDQRDGEILSSYFHCLKDKPNEALVSRWSELCYLICSLVFTSYYSIRYLYER